ncbi:MAG: hypothetical protein P4L43_12790 [Syntrophobacteraceae bacterium]|nr:hypothetical protein [Syntrophobacteraceae bacterium]
MSTNDTKGIAIYRLLILFISFVYVTLITVSVFYTLLDAKYKTQIDNQTNQLSIDNKALADLSNENANFNSLFQTIKVDYNNIYSKNSDLAVQLHSYTQKYAALNSKLTSCLDDIKAANIDTGRLKDVTANLQIFKDIIAPYLVLEPVWVGSGVGTSTFNGNLMIILYENTKSDKSCHDSSSICYLIEKGYKKKLCLDKRKPVVFSYQRNQYLFDLVRAQQTPDGSHRYCISILKKW